MSASKQILAPYLLTTDTANSPNQIQMAQSTSCSDSLPTSTINCPNWNHEAQSLSATKPKRYR